MIKTSIFPKYENKINYFQLVEGSLNPYLIVSKDEYSNGLIELTKMDIGSGTTKDKVLIDSERKYLEDFKPFSDLFTLKSIFLHLVKASLVPANLIVHEYNVHLMESLELDESEREDFDWNKSLLKNYELFITTWKKMMSVSLIRKLFEEAAFNYLHIKITDKLTKDVGKSIFRKSLKFSRFVACKRIFFTALWSNFFYHLSSYVYDIVYSATVIIMDNNTKEGDSVIKRFRNRRFVDLLFKKFGYFSVCLISSAGGFAVGSYFNLKYGGAAVSLAAEMLGGLSFSVLVGI